MAEKKAAKEGGARIVESSAEEIAAIAKAQSDKAAQGKDKKPAKEKKKKSEKADPLQGLSRAKKRQKLMRMEDEVCCFCCCLCLHVHATHSLICIVLCCVVFVRAEGGG